MTIRQESEKKSRRNRECWFCSKTIKKNEDYWNKELRYDKTILTLSFHLSCCDKDKSTSELETLICNSYLNIEQYGSVCNDNLEAMKSISDKLISD